MDLLLFRMINDLALTNPVLDQIAALLSSYGIVVMITAILFLLLRKHSRQPGLLGVLSLAIALGINRVLKVVIDRPRPFMDHTVNLVIERGPSPSFPSDQALIAGVFVIIAWIAYKKVSVRLIASLFAGVVILSRVFVGHHYPSDVVVGSVLGILLTGAVVISSKRIAQKRMEKSNQLSV